MDESQENQQPAMLTDNQQEAQPTLTIQDLNTILGIIDTASSRGAFKGSELHVVGEQYDKITAFIALFSNQGNQ